LFNEPCSLKATTTEVKPFVAEPAGSVALKKLDKASKTAHDKARQYTDTNELPKEWDRSDLLGYTSDDRPEVTLVFSFCPINEC